MTSTSEREIETVVKEVALQSLKHNYSWVADHLDLSDEALLPVVEYLCIAVGGEKMKLSA
tara:strand:+ start:151 stop:330 length:180 start_codon:yes stop_codon:yes gene_type:complete